MLVHVFTPYIRLDGEYVVRQGLGGCPFDGELCPFSGIVDVTFHQSTETKVGHFHQVVVPNQAVPSSQVPGMGIIHIMIHTK